MNEGHFFGKQSISVKIQYWCRHIYNAIAMMVKAFRNIISSIAMTPETFKFLRALAST